MNSSGSQHAYERVDRQNTKRGTVVRTAIEEEEEEEGGGLETGESSQPQRGMSHNDTNDEPLSEARSDNLDLAERGKVSDVNCERISTRQQKIQSSV
jgi:hypothetical protein